MTDLGRILQAGRALTEAEVLLLSERLETPEQRQRRRRDARDDAIRSALAVITDRGAQSDANAAAELARRLTQYLSGAAWKAERQLDSLSGPTDPLRLLLHRIVQLNDGRPRGLGIEHLRRISRGQRSSKSWA